MIPNMKGGYRIIEDGLIVGLIALAIDELWWRQALA